MPQKPPIDVLVALDEEDVREEVLATLALHPQYDVWSAPWPAGDVGRPPTVLIGSSQSPESIAAVRARLGGLKAVLLISSDPNVDAARRAVVSGADGILLRADVPAALQAAIEAAMAGLLVLSAPLGSAVARPSLSPREKQILALVVMGMSNAEIAERLVVAESTVKSHLFSAYRRLGVRTRRQAVALIMDPDRGLGSGILGLTQN